MRQFLALPLASIMVAAVSAPVHADGPATLYLPAVGQTPATESAKSTSPLTIVALSCYGETVQVMNSTQEHLDLLGWAVRSARSGRSVQRFTFPSFNLRPGESAFVHSGPDAPPTGGNHFRWTSRYIWNNDGDRADLYAPDGTVVDRKSCYKE